jgi:hypothetical protein
MFVTICLPDEVFQDIVEEALEWTISCLCHARANRETYQKLLPHVSDYLNLSTALELLHQLQRCHIAPEWYLLQSPHRVALSDVLHRYCERYNEQPQGFRVHDKYGLLDVEWAPMLRFFIGEPYQDGSIMAPVNTESMTLRPSNDSSQQSMIRAEQSPFYRRGVPTYPAPRNTP